MQYIVEREVLDPFKFWKRFHFTNSKLAMSYAISQKKNHPESRVNIRVYGEVSKN